MTVLINAGVEQTPNGQGSHVHSLTLTRYPEPIPEKVVLWREGTFNSRLDSKNADKRAHYIVAR